MDARIARLRKLVDEFSCDEEECSDLHLLLDQEEADVVAGLLHGMIDEEYVAGRRNFTDARRAFMQLGLSAEACAQLRQSRLHILQM